MALKYKLTKDAHAKLSDELKAFYVEKDGEFVLDAEGLDEPSDALKRAKDREAQKAKEEKERADRLQAELDDVTGNDAKKRGDVEALTKSYEEKLTKQKTESNAKIEKLQKSVQRTLLESRAEALATKISTVPSLMAKTIRERLTIDFEGDEPQLRVLDKDGKPSAHTLEDLEKEIVANKEYSAILVGSKATGSRTSDSNKQTGNGRAQLDANGKPTPFRAMSMDDKKALIKERIESKNASNT